MIKSPSVKQKLGIVNLILNLQNLNMSPKWQAKPRVLVQLLNLTFFSLQI